MNKTIIVVATITLSAIAVGLFVMLTAPHNTATVAETTAPAVTQNSGHPVLDRFEKTRIEVQSKDKIGAIQAAIDSKTGHSANQ